MGINSFRFEDWKVYKDARLFRLEINKLLKRFPKEETYSLTSQTKRALDSILLNLAEGSNKRSDKDTRLYIDRSLGSLDEVVACLDCALDSKYINISEYQQSLLEAENLDRQLKSFSVYLSRVKD